MKKRANENENIKPEFKVTKMRRMKSTSSIGSSPLSSSPSFSSQGSSPLSSSPSFSSLTSSSSTSPSVESVIEIKIAENRVIELTPKIIESLFKGLDTKEKIQEKVNQLSGLITADLNSASDKKARMKSYTALYGELQNAHPPVDKAILTAFAKAIAAYDQPEKFNRARLLMLSGGQAIEAQVKQDLEVVKVDTLLKRQDFLNEAKELNSVLNNVLNTYNKDRELESRPLDKVASRAGWSAPLETSTDDDAVSLSGPDYASADHPSAAASQTMQSPKSLTPGFNSQKETKSEQPRQDQSAVAGRCPTPKNP